MKLQHCDSESQSREVVLGASRVAPSKALGQSGVALHAAAHHDYSLVRLIENFRDIGYELRTAVVDLMDHFGSSSWMSHVLLAAPEIRGAVLRFLRFAPTRWESVGSADPPGHPRVPATWPEDDSRRGRGSTVGSSYDDP